MKVQSSITVIASVALFGMVYANATLVGPSIRTFNSNASYNSNPPLAVPIALKHLAPIVSYNSNLENQSWNVSDLNDLGNALVEKIIWNQDETSSEHYFWTLGWGTTGKIFLQLPGKYDGKGPDWSRLDNQNRVAGYIYLGEPTQQGRVISWAPGDSTAHIPSVQDSIFDQNAWIGSMNRSGTMVGYSGARDASFRWTIGQSAVHFPTFPSTPPNTSWSSWRINSLGQTAGIAYIGDPALEQSFIHDGVNTRLVGPTAQNDDVTRAWVSPEISDNGSLVIRKDVQIIAQNYAPLRTEIWYIGPGEINGRLLNAVDHPTENPYSVTVGWPSINRLGQVVWATEYYGDANSPSISKVYFYNPADNRLNVFDSDDSWGELLTDNGDLYFSSNARSSGSPLVNFWNPQLGASGPFMVKVAVSGADLAPRLANSRQQIVARYSGGGKHNYGLFAPQYRPTPPNPAPPIAAPSASVNPAPTGLDSAVIAREIAQLRDQLVKDRRIKNPQARARAMRSTNLKIRMLSEGVNPNSPKGLLMIQIDNARRLPPGPQKVKTIARLQNQLADLEKTQ